jgi:RNA polymerase sigma-70 factor (ECF subfamily)
LPSKFLDKPDLAQLERIIRLHLASAYNYARWLTRNDADAEDVVQDACARAWKYSNTFRGENAKSWFMTTVRNAAFSWIKKNRQPQNVPLDDELDSEDMSKQSLPVITDAADIMALKAAMNQLAPEFIEVLVLKELEGYSYHEIAQITDVPVGTVMSRLSRARAKLQILLAGTETPGERK